MSTRPAVSSNTRTTRSRFSSPQVAGNGATDPSSRAQGNANGTGAATNGLGEGGHKTLLQRWLEPPVQVKASYQDAGLVRQGVFENMAPLGTLPKVGIFKKTVPAPAAAPEQTQTFIPTPTAGPVRRIVVKQKPVLTSAPAPPPPPPAPEEDETEEDETEDEDDGKTEDQDEDRDGLVNKNNNKSRTTAAAAQRSRRSMASAETDDEEWAQGTSAQKGRTTRSASRASTAGPLQQPAGGANADAQPVSQKEFIDKVVEAAVDEALTHFRYPTAWALRTLYDENSANQEFLDMIQKVFLQTTNADELEEFARRIHAKKKEGKKDNKAFYYFVPPSTNSHSAAHPPKRAPYGNLLKFDVSTLRLDQDAGSSKPLKRERPAAAQEPEPEPERDAEPQEPEEPELRPRKRRKSGRQHQEATPSSSTKMAANGVKVEANAIAKTPSRKRTRQRSVSSISSLSSARSLSPPEGIQTDGEKEGSDEPPSRTSPAPPPQPITAGKRRRSNAPRKSRNVSPSRPSPAPSTTPAPQQPAAAAAPSQPSKRHSPAAVEPEQQPYEMPAVVDSPLFPNLNSKKGGKSGTPTLIFATKLGKIDPEDPKLRLRQSAREATNKSFEVSNVRESSLQLSSEREEPDERVKPVAPRTPATATATATPSAVQRRTSLPPARPTPAPREGRSTRSSLKRTHDDLEDQPSPTTTSFNFAGSEAASTVAGSRAGTPALRAAKKPRTGLRVKNS